MHENERIEDLLGRLGRGNHKSAKDNAAFLEAALQKEVQKGWLLPLPAAQSGVIPNLELAPLGVAVHLGINIEGDYVPKQRVTHDLSFPGECTGESVNSRVLVEELEPCMFGHMMSRLLHYIISVRKRYPNVRIWLRKEDFKSAYRRVHLNAATAWKSVVRMTIEGNDLLLVSLRLPFGGAPCPADFSLVSDVITDTINDLLEDKTWDHREITAEFVAMIPKESSLPDEIPFATARELSVEVPNVKDGKADVYIDDIISCTPDIGDNLGRVEAAACTVIQAIAHKANGTTYLPRQPFISEAKMWRKEQRKKLKYALDGQLTPEGC